MRCLILNTYAGSLLLGASKVNDIEIIGSYEDAGYGSDIQAANFPHVNLIERTPWPDQNLEDVMVIAHPPCAAFSPLNYSRIDETNGINNKMGVDAEKFKCTVEVAHYALKNRAAILAIESVPGALEGARAVHDEIGAEYGYGVFRITQNAVSFGVPQFRPRFWVVFSRLPQLHLALAPRKQSVLDVIMMTQDPYDIDPGVDVITQWQIANLFDKLSYDQADSVLHDNVGGLVPAKVAKLVNKDLRECVKEYGIGGWTAAQMRVLDTTKYANTLLANSWWYVQTNEHDGRPLTRGEYNAIMGFPRNYIFPGPTRSMWRKYLSCGVCPPVAEWIVTQLKANLEQKLDPASQVPGSHIRVIRPNEIANFIQGVV